MNNVRGSCPECGSEDINVIRSAELSNYISSWKMTGKDKIVPDAVDGNALITPLHIIGYQCNSCLEIFEYPLFEQLDQDISPLEKFVFKWKGYRFVSSTGKTKEFENFISDFRKAINEELFEGLTVSVNAGHFYFYGFFHDEHTDRWAYYSVSDVRYFQDGWVHDVLIRTAENDRDYTGGINNSVNIARLVSMAGQLTGGNNVEEL